MGWNWRGPLGGFVLATTIVWLVARDPYHTPWQLAAATVMGLVIYVVGWVSPLEPYRFAVQGVRYEVFFTKGRLRTQRPHEATVDLPLARDSGTHTWHIQDGDAMRPLTDAELIDRLDRGYRRYIRWQMPVRVNFKAPHTVAPVYTAPELHAPQGETAGATASTLGLPLDSTPAWALLATGALRAVWGSPPDGAPWANFLVALCLFGLSLYFARVAPKQRELRRHTFRQRGYDLALVALLGWVFAWPIH